MATATLTRRREAPAAPGAAAVRAPGGAGGEEGGRSVADLAAAARGGDGQAFEVLVLRFQAPLTAYCRVLMADRGLGEDVAQETFLLVHRRLPLLRDPGAFRPWLYRIAEHVARSGRRRRFRRVREVPLHDFDPPASPHRPSPLVERDGGGDGAVPPPSGRGGAAGLVREALDRMPETYAGVLALHYVQDMSCREIAAALGITQNNARQRLYRARLALRRDPACRALQASADA